MGKTLISTDQYIDELNRQLKVDKDFESGMEFLPSPDGAQGSKMSGYTIAGRFAKPAWTLVYSRVAHKVAEEFEAS